ncbi:YfaP family protein [Ideonella livida]|uniref:DUF2135 domain-containing protein n=1 Tax=Ideonella livida TaxID=2707176 RepID=A0A7C9PHC4_9BURK|nr:DUF2135 domain-containing protein [Ideonella livida]NDY91290.1 DUF2135 domain-containing protein [Ideonella livida]
MSPQPHSRRTAVAAPPTAPAHRPWALLAALNLWFCAAGPGLAAPPGILQDPVGGWRHTEVQAGELLQEVHYPAASVSAERAPPGGRIQGRLVAPRPDGRPLSPAAAPLMGRLVVDGVAMPLAVAPDGHFQRPWSFGAGPHAVTVRQGTQGGRTQFFETASPRTRPALRVVLSWDSPMTDLDLHLLSPEGEHVFYGARVSPSGGVLDVDVTTGYGPEIFVHPRPTPGVWQVLVNYFGAGEAQDGLTVAQIALIEHEGTPREKQQVWRVPMRKPGELTLVRRFTVGAPP